MPSATRFLTGLASLVGLLAFVVGIPIALWAVAGSPIPEALPTWDQVTSTLSRPDYTGALTLTIIKIGAWIAWATFAIAVIVEIPAQLRGVRAPRLRGLGLQQRAAATMVASAIALFGIAPVAATAAAMPAAAVEAAPAAVVQTIDHADTMDHPTAGLDDETAEDSTPSTHTYTVQPGDSLWRIAERELGDGSRYQEIADLNYGVPQPGGYALDSSHWIDPGWKLQLPGSAHAHAAVDADTDASAHQVTVQPGDSLSSIAADELDDADRWPEIYEASKGIEQPDGGRLTDPSLIRPGWTLQLPADTTEVTATSTASAGTETTSETGAADVDQEPTTDAQEESAPAEEPAVTVGEQPGVELVAPLTAVVPEAVADVPAETIDTPSQSVDQVEGSSEEAPEADDAVVRTAAGVGGLLAAGVLGLLATRRILARRRRRAGQRITLPAPESSESVLEAELRAVADPIGVEIVDVALRSMAAWHRQQGLPLPDVRAARLRGDYFELYLDQPADLPAPWISTAERHVWQLTAHDAASIELTAAAAATPAPYPSLVTIGHDQEDAHLLLDLEQLDCLDVRGDTDAAHATLAALGIELATSRWADDVQITLIGVMDPHATTTLDTGRLRHVSGLDAVIDELEARAADVTRTLADVGATSVADARGRGLADDAWTPEILLVGTGLSPEDRRRLEDLISRIPRIGVAAVTTEASLGEWVLDIDPTDTTQASLEPAGLTIRPQQLDPDTYTHLLTLIAQDHTTSTDGPAWASRLTEAAPPELDDLDPGLVLVTTDVDDTPPSEIDVDQEPETDDTPEITWPDGPVLSIMGDVEVVGATGTAPASSHLPRTTELVAYLTLHPAGVTTEQLTAAIWPASRPEAAAKTRPPAISRARRWLTTEHLPRHDADRLYKVTGVTTDYDLFLNLVGDDVTTTPTRHLLAALELVRGRPFQNAKTTSYVWAEAITQDIMAAVVDVAHEVATRALTTGDVATARKAAEAGRRIDPADERGWRDGIRAEWAAGRRDAANRLVDQLQAHLTDLDIEPEPETAELLADLTDRIAN